MVVRTQAPAAVANRGRQLKRHGMYRCCYVAAADTDSDSGDSAYIKDASDASTPQQQPLHRWKQLQQQPEDQQPAAIRTVTISSSLTPSDTSNDVAALQHHQQQLCTPNAARSLVTRAAPPSTAATYNSTLPSRTVTPLTDFSVVTTAAVKPTTATTAVASSTVGQAFSKASRSIQQCGTGDSPSEIHSDLAVDYQQQQQQSSTRTHSTNSPVRRLDSHSVSRSISGSCHATASSAGSSSSSVAGGAAAAAAAGRAGDSGTFAELVIALSPAGPADCELESGGPPIEHDPTTDTNLDNTRRTDTPDVLGPVEDCIGSLHREISLSPAAAATAAATAAASADHSASSSSSSSHKQDFPGVTESAAAAAATGGFRFSNSGSFPGSAAAADDDPSSSTVPAAASPFAHLSLQKTVANTLLSSARQHQQYAKSLRTAATMPASVASFTTAASTSAAAAAAGVRVSSSSGPAALAGVTSRVSRVSWATASTVLGADPSEVFEVLDPETASVNDGHKILKKSASTSSVSVLGSSSSSTGRNKLQQIRSAMSFGGAGARSEAGAAAGAAADSSNLDDQAVAAAAGGNSSSGFKKVWRRSTHHQATASSLKGPGSVATVARRSKSAHESILAQQQQQQQQRVPQLSDPGLPPPYPAAAAASGRHSSSLSSSGRLASAEVQSSSSSIGLGASGSSSSSSPDMAGRLDRSKISTKSAPAKSAGSGGSTGSLVGLAVTRMHTAQSAPLMSSTPTSSSSTGSSTAASGLSSMGSMTSTSSSSLAAAAVSPGSSIDLSKASSIQIANAFAEAFLAALAAGNTKWASQATVAQMIHDTAKMVGIDKQLHTGKTAIIRRLNSGMEQLVKMVRAYVDNTNSSSGTGKDASKDPDQSNVMSDLAKDMPKPLLSVTCPDPKTKPSTVVALYTFKWGIRKFTFRDEFIVKNGQIMRLRRSRS